MFNQKQAKKQTEKELVLMQNRIRLLKIQEDKIKKRNELNTKRIEDYWDQK